MKIKNRFAFATSILFLFLLFSPAWAQQPVIQDDSLYSAILKEQRTIKIIFPKNYQPGSTDTFDMLYVLDGEWNTSLAEKVHGFLAYAEFIPTNMVIVSIPNLYREAINLRDRDFTPTANKNNQLSGSDLAGGANNFLAFLEDELIPYIHSKYPVKIENSTLYGTSLGGLFAIYAFLHKPTLFKSYLTVEPSLWWDDKYIHQIAPKKLEEMKGINNTLFIASRDGDAYHEMGIADFEALLVQKAPSNLSWKTEAYPNETHFSSIWKGIYDGLKFTYEQ